MREGGWWLGAALGVMLLGPSAASAGVLERTDIGATFVVEAETGARYLEVALPQVPCADTEVLFAELAFTATLAPGVEVELWPWGEAESLPWEAEAPGAPLALWMMESSARVVRLDVTEICRAAARSGTAPRALLRLAPLSLPEDGLEWEGTDWVLRVHGTCERE